MRRNTYNFKEYLLQVETTGIHDNVLACGAFLSVRYTEKAT